VENGCSLGSTVTIVSVAGNSHKQSRALCGILMALAFETDWINPVCGSVQIGLLCWCFLMDVKVPLNNKGAIAMSLCCCWIEMINQSINHFFINT